MKLTELWSALKDLPIEEFTEKVTWHRKCYQETTHSGMLKRARERFQREAAGSNKSRRKSSDNVQAEQRFFLPDHKLPLLTRLPVSFATARQEINSHCAKYPPCLPEVL